MNESTNESVYVSIPSLRFLLQDDHIFAMVVLPLVQSMFGLFYFIHVICIISSAHEIMKTWKALLEPHCLFNIITCIAFKTLYVHVYLLFQNLNIYSVNSVLYKYVQYTKI